METIFWGGLLRAGQAAFAAGPTLLVGFFVAGVLRRFFGPEMTHKAFGGSTWRSLPQAWFWGMLLPVCSLGVIPIAYELRRAKLSGGAILAFSLTAPLFNPLSLLYGLTLATPEVILAFACGSLLVVTVVGVLWDKIFPQSASSEPFPAQPPPGLKRLLAVLVSMVRSAAGPTLLFCLIGFAGSLLLCAIYPAGSLGDAMAHTDPLAPLEAVVLSIPAYATPLHVMMQVGSMFVHGNSVGAAYVLLSLGAGANLGLLAWTWVTYGFRKAATFLLLFTSVVVAIAYAIEDPLYASGNVDHPHTHAFDRYSNPFPASSSSQGDMPARVWDKLKQSVPLFEAIGLACVCGLILPGVALRVADPDERIDIWLTKAPLEDRNRSVLSVYVPAPVLGVVAIVGLVALSIVGCYIYYPAPAETLEDMKIARAEALSAVSSQESDAVVRQIARYDDLTRKLQVGYYLREGSLDEYQRLRVKALRGWLEQLKDLIEAGELQRAQDLRYRVSESHRRVVEAFRPA